MYHTSHVVVFIVVSLSFSWHKLAKSDKAEKIPLKPDDKDSVEAIAEQILKATKLKEKASNDQEKLVAAAKLEEAKTLQKNVRTVLLIAAVLFVR